MRPDRISYKKIFPIGSYTNETIGMEAQLDEGDSADACLLELKKQVEEFHQKNNLTQVHDFNIGGIQMQVPISQPIQSIDPRAKDLEEIIQDCNSLEELEKLKDEAGRLGLLSAYNLKRETFKK